MSSRRFYTGDEQGLIKVVTITEPAAVKKRVRRGQPTPEPPPKPVPTIETWGTPDRDRGIQQLCWDHGDKYLVVARKNGLVQLIDPKDKGSVVAEFKHKFVKEGKVDTTFVGLFANSESIITCTNTGVLTIQSIQNQSQTKTASVGVDICKMRVHPNDHNIIATGGKEQEITIWNLNELCNDPSKETQEATGNRKKTKGGKPAPSPASKAKPTSEEKPQNDAPGARYKSKEVLAKGQIFKAKNVKNDYLDLRVPVWNTDFQFLSQSDSSRIAVGTRHHQIRVYDTKSGARRPTLDKEIGDMPVVAMANVKDLNEIVFSDTMTNVYSVDTLTGAILGQYKGITGVVTDLVTFRPVEDESTIHLASVSMDRHLRIHEMDQTRKLLHKVYLKQRMTAVVVGEYTPAEPAEDEDEGDTSKKSRKSEAIVNDDGDDDEDVWESMAKLQDRKTKKRKAGKE
ncbi:WD40-repeat-containing domain protein [Mortierella sp. GBAus27b]|nr:WD repeat-containing protein 74 [Mortierella sp. GBA43]KAI8360474.1 WD40-repeat-containing domain protein [Mortierella sp. GBAus27b]